MVIFVALVLTILSFAAVAIPLFRSRDNSERAWTREFEEFDESSGSTAVMVRQLETDYRTGIVSEEDYRRQQSAFQAAVTGDVEPAVSQGTMEDEIEKKVAGLRGRDQSGLDADIEAKIRQLRQSTPDSGGQPPAGGVRQKKARFCQQCGSKIQPGARFCAQCGEDVA